jgi:hypothetical protein
MNAMGEGSATIQVCGSRFAGADLGINPMDTADLYRGFEMGGAIRSISAIFDALVRVFGPWTKPAASCGDPVKIKRACFW